MTRKLNRLGSGTKKLAFSSAVFAIVTLGSIRIAEADAISVCTGAGCSTTNVTGSIVAGAGTVTITLNNNLTNAQVDSIFQNISAVYFDVSGFNLGAVSLSASSSAQSTNIDVSGNAVLAGAVNPTGWAAGNSLFTIEVCVICAFGASAPADPEQTIIGGTGSGTYPNANGSIAGASANPFLVGTTTFTLIVPGVTANSTFSNVIVQFGPLQGPAPVPEPASVFLLGTGLLGLAGAARRRFRR